MGTSRSKWEGRDVIVPLDPTSPIDPGYNSRKSLYNLYHILNHFNLFGGSYAGQADRLIASLLAHKKDR
jgi:protein-ribulosamine 3-kinase